MRSRASDPDFVPSLRLLAERERYSCTDIGLMFGVSRCRVDQWFEKYCISNPDPPRQRGLMSVRVWDDDAHRFRPVRKGIVRSIRFRAKAEEMRAERGARQEARRREMIEIIVRLQASLGRDPSLDEMASSVFGKAVPRCQGGPYLASRWSTQKLPMRKKYREAMAAICAATGMSVERPRGGRSHIGKRVVA